MSARVLIAASGGEDLPVQIQQAWDVPGGHPPHPALCADPPLPAVRQRRVDALRLYRGGALGLVVGWYGTSAKYSSVSGLAARSLKGAK